MTLGTLQNNSQAVPDISYDGRWPIDGADTSMPIYLNFTYTHSTHIFKAGVTRVYERFGQARSSTFAGQFDFSNDSNDPLNTGFPLANMYLGHVTSYTESMGRVPDNRRQYTWGWFVQDTWKARRNITIDYGLRMYKWSPALQGGHEASAFSFDRFDPKWGGKPPVYYTPVLRRRTNPCSGTNRKALNPITRRTAPLVVHRPDGPRAPDIAAVRSRRPLRARSTASSSRTIRPIPMSAMGSSTSCRIQFDPRFGIAWDPKADGKMVIRLGIGAFHDPTGGPTNKGGPAYSFDQVVRYTDLNSYFLGVGPTSPTSVSVFWKDGQKRPVTYQYNFGIQRDIGFKTVLDFAYVGSNTHHNIAELELQRAAGRRAVPAAISRSDRNCDGGQSGSAARYLPAADRWLWRYRHQRTGNDRALRFAAGLREPPLRSRASVHGRVHVGRRHVEQLVSEQSTALQRGPPAQHARAEGGGRFQLHLGYPDREPFRAGEGRQRGLRRLAVAGRLDLRHRTGVERQRWNHG